MHNIVAILYHPFYIFLSYLSFSALTQSVRKRSAYYIMKNGRVDCILLDAGVFMSMIFSKQSFPLTHTRNSVRCYCYSYGCRFLFHRCDFKNCDANEGLRNDIRFIFIRIPLECEILSFNFQSSISNIYIDSIDFLEYSCENACSYFCWTHSIPLLCTFVHFSLEIMATIQTHYTLRVICIKE